MSTSTALDIIADRYTGRPDPVAYVVTDAGLEALAASGPPCPRWRQAAGDGQPRPCLLTAGHDGQCNTRAHGRSRI